MKIRTFRRSIQHHNRITPSIAPRVNIFRVLFDGLKVVLFTLIVIAIMLFHLWCIPSVPVRYVVASAGIVLGCVVFLFAIHDVHVERAKMKHRTKFE